MHPQSHRAPEVLQSVVMGRWRSWAAYLVGEAASGLLPGVAPLGTVHEIVPYRTLLHRIAQGMG
jgi:hypothetical protein